MMVASFRRILWLALALGWMGFIYYLSSQSTIPVHAVETGTGGSLALRKLGHAAVFGVLALLLRSGLAFNRRRPLAFGAAFAFAVAYAIVDEVHQRFTPGRSASAIDAVIDSAGAFAALGLWRAVEAVTPLLNLRLRPRSRPKPLQRV